MRDWEEKTAVKEKKIILDYIADDFLIIFFSSSS